jgi:hypothetical protein
MTTEEEQIQSALEATKRELADEDKRHAEYAGKRRKLEHQILILGAELRSPGMSELHKNLKEQCANLKRIEAELDAAREIFCDGFKKYEAMFNTDTHRYCPNCREIVVGRMCGYGQYEYSHTSDYERFTCGPEIPPWKIDEFQPAPQQK